MEDEIMKNCVNTDDLYDIVSGEASDEICSVFAEHVKVCEKCRQEYESIKKIQDTLKSCTSEPSADFTERTMKRLKTVNKNPIIRITGSRTFKAATAIAACLVLVFAVYGRGFFDGKVLSEADSTNPASYSRSDSELEAVDSENPSDIALYTEGDYLSGEVAVPEGPQPPSSCEEPASDDEKNAKPMAPNVPTADSKSEASVTNPSASDAFSSNPKIPEYIYFPTELFNSVTITEAIYDHDTTLIDTADGIYFAIYEKKVAVSQYKWIQEKYNTQFVVDCTIPGAQITEIPSEDDTQETENEEYQPVEPIAPEIAFETIDFTDGLYISTFEGDSIFTIYWYENECFYRLVLPNEYRDENELRFTDLTLIKNPQY